MTCFNTSPSIDDCGILLCLTLTRDLVHRQWHMVIHDFTADQAQMATEAIVNMIINSQVQTLLKVFQYKSVSSLYKMLREKITSSLQSYDMHFELCKREIVTRLQDPLLTMKFRDMTQRLTGSKCTTQEYVSTDCMLSGEWRVLCVIWNELTRVPLKMPRDKSNRESTNWMFVCLLIYFFDYLFYKGDNNWEPFKYF